jgi:hypothetical protein
MADLRSVLDEATQAKLISPETSDRLLPFLADRGVAVSEGFVAAQPEPPHTLAEELLSVEPDTETPRFIRGFHDILITIGVVILLCGLWGIASLYVVLPAIILLSEVLVRRQRLALPAVALTIALVSWTAKFMTLADPAIDSIWSGTDFPILYLAGFPVALGLYYLRYRVPLSFALCVMSGLGLLLALIFRAMQWISGDPLFPVDRLGVLGAILLFSALSLFAIALYFDLSDTKRVTRRSDIAFWLHMATAPALLYSTIFVFSPEGSLFDLAQSVSARTPTVVITVALMMLIGLIVDRRAFVTAGLLSLGVAIYGVFRHGGASVDTYLYMTLLTVGVIVLVIGIGWVPLRRLTLRLLPHSLSSRLPRAL